MLYLEQQWSEREVQNFVIRVNEVLQRISENPRLYKKSKQKDIHEAVISKHNTALLQGEIE
jgi:hypothetical protein